MNLVVVRVRLQNHLMKLHEITDGEINIDLNGRTQNIYDINRKEDLDFRKKVQWYSKTLMLL